MSTLSKEYSYAVYTLRCRMENEVKQFTQDHPALPAEAIMSAAGDFLMLFALERVGKIAALDFMAQLLHMTALLDEDIDPNKLNIRIPSDPAKQQ